MKSIVYGAIGGLASGLYLLFFFSWIYGPLPNPVAGTIAFLTIAGAIIGYNRWGYLIFFGLIIGMTFAPLRSGFLGIMIGLFIGDHLYNYVTKNKKPTNSQ